MTYLETPWKDIYKPIQMIKKWVKLNLEYRTIVRDYMSLRREPMQLIVNNRTLVLILVYLIS